MAGIASSYLLPRVRRQVEHQDGEEGDPHARDDEVHCVEQGLAAHGEVEGDIWVG